jgi:hypothetical protein
MDAASRRVTVSRLAMSVPEFLATKRLGLPAMGTYSMLVDDIFGALEARQAGAVAEAVHHLLLVGIRNFAFSRGRFVEFHEDTWFVEPQEDPFRVLKELLGESNEVYNEAWSLFIENPATDEETELLATRVLEFIDWKLDVSEMYPWWEGALDREHYRRFWEMAAPIVIACDELGVNPEGTPQDRFVEMALKVEKGEIDFST